MEEPSQNSDTPGASSDDKDGSAKPKKKKRSAMSYALAFFGKVGATALVIWVLLHFVAGIYVNHSNSSYPMIKDGDLCLTYRLAELRQGDAVAYRTADGIRFGRVIAQAGDSVSIESDYIAVNGYGIFEDVVYPTTTEGAKITFPYTVPENCVFVLNDYRSDVSDSRTLGSIPMEDVQGKVVFIMRRRGI